MARILIVEDEPAVRAAVASMLELGGHATLAVEPSAQLFAEVSGLEFDLVVTDIRMPSVSGWEVAAWVRRNRPEVPVIALSGFVDLIDASGTRTLFSAVLRKPVRSGDLLREVEHVLASASSRTARPGGSRSPQ
jgi:CheY-like chemotaxis protein